MTRTFYRTWFSSPSLRTLLFWLPAIFLTVFIPLFAGLPGTFARGEELTVKFGDQPILPAFGSVTGTWFYADARGGQYSSQLLLLGHNARGPNQEPCWEILADVAPGETITLTLAKAGRMSYSFQPLQGENHADCTSRIQDGSLIEEITLRGGSDQRAVTRINNITVLTEDGDHVGAVIEPQRRPQPRANLEKAGKLAGLTIENQTKLLTAVTEPVDCYPDMTNPLWEELVIWDWKMRDGIGTEKEPRTYLQAVQAMMTGLRAQLDDFLQVCDESQEELGKQFQERFDQLTAVLQNADKKSVNNDRDENYYKGYWLSAHRLRREMALAHPLFPKRPILFAKYVPGGLSHQLNQIYGYASRPGGGLFILEKPGRSNKTREIPTGLPLGSYMTPTLSYDGKTILFSFCAAPVKDPEPGVPESADRYYQVYSIGVDGSNLRQLTDGPYDHFAARFLPDGDIILSSTRRGGFHRCGSGPCPVYTISRMRPDGSDFRVLSWHETNEWDPFPTADGRLIYTRWDYVDRGATFYQNLWSMRPDGTDVRIYYGNNTFSPTGLWEAKAVPGSAKIMAVSGPHHGLSAGSVVLVDNTLGVDGAEPITRVTPEALFPEAEVPMPSIPPLPTRFDFDTPAVNFWDGNKPERPAERLTRTVENSRWPVHCFKSPQPFSEKQFLASYSFDKLLGEAGPNIPNQFGLYWCDTFGTRELLFRDPNISSLWGTVLEESAAAPIYRSTLPKSEPGEAPLPGRFFVRNVYENWPWKMPEGVKIKSLRIVQVLPKTTPNANQPKVGVPFASPGKQILGTVPVADDGSAYFEAPSRIPFLIQALDERGRMVQGMRSLIYAQPGETQSCTGCHEDRMSAAHTTSPASLPEHPSAITPGPSGSRPFSYPLLVQPVLDAKCVGCHNDERAEGGVNLTGTPEGEFSRSYNALMPLVSYSAWTLPEGNHEPMTTPGLLGTPASRLIELLDAGHYDVSLSDDDWERLCTWIDGSNALFYGTFQPDKQKIQQTGGTIDGPDLE